MNKDVTITLNLEAITKELQEWVNDPHTIEYQKSFWTEDGEFIMRFALDIESGVKGWRYLSVSARRVWASGPWKSERDKQIFPL